MDSGLRVTAGDLGRAIAAGKADPMDLTERYLAAIAAHPAEHEAEDGHHHHRHEQADHHGHRLAGPDSQGRGAD